MKYFQIFYPYDRLVDHTYWKIFSRTVLVEAETFESACDKIKKLDKHKHDKFFDFTNLTIS
jgi:hypothetical protein